MKKSEIKAKSKDQTQNQEAQLSFPDVTPLDHVKLCPRFTSILNRPDGDGVGIEEIDSLQMEIESLLVNVMQRNRLLKIESMILDNDKNADTILIKSNSFQLNSASSNNLLNTPKDKSGALSITKRNKSFSGKPSNPLPVTEQTPPIVRNDIPDIFWQSVEPYCADLNEDDLKFLESQIEQSDKYSNLNVKIAPLGKHYSIQWAEEDLQQQMKEGSRFPDLNDSKSTPLGGLKRKASFEHTPTSYFLKKQSLIEESLEKLKKNQQTENVNYGPLTQRLISALIEQNLMTPFDNELTDYLDKIGPPQSSYLSPKSMAKKFSFNTTSNNIERKIKKTLIEQGILEMDENEKMDYISDDNSSQLSLADGSNENVVISKDDEIANEILNVQNELRVVSKQCKQTLEQLLVISKQNMAKQELKKKISSIDMEIIEFYEKFKQARLNKKPILKKDKEKAQRLINEREQLSNQLKDK